MTNQTQIENPFQITTPEDLTADETISLFVDVFTDFSKIVDPGHVFVMGPRGSGKSMMFRYLMPDCQLLRLDVDLSKLPHLGIYIPLKNTNFALTELRRLEDRHASSILNEHILVSHFCIRIFETLYRNINYNANSETARSAVKYFNQVFLPAVGSMYDSERIQVGSETTVTSVFEKIVLLSENIYRDAVNFAKRLSFSKETHPYDGPLFDYLGFLLPLLSKLSTIDGFPNCPIYLLIDDAHLLTDTQARVLNSWVGTRTSRKVSLKISTQYEYKTFYTTSGQFIETPHDYSIVDVATVYTGNNKSKYRDRLSSIVGKRLERCQLSNISPNDFFPEDAEQEKKIRDIAQAYVDRFENGQGRGHYRHDDANRYARPDYIKSLSGTTKASSKYSYAGFNQLVHISSGVIRHFLHAAHLMFAQSFSESSTGKVTSISTLIQSSVVRQEADNFLFHDIERLNRDDRDPESLPKEDLVRLINLVQGLGGLFRQILLSDRSERRVFSVAISDSPSESILRIFALGVQLGYFHKSTIGRKDSKSGGRTILYVLSRRLAPIWTLDPTGFAGYLFITNQFLEEAMTQPTRLLRRIAKDGIPEEIESVQLEFMFEGDSTSGQ